MHAGMQYSFACTKHYESCSQFAMLFRCVISNMFTMNQRYYGSICYYSSETVCYPMALILCSLICTYT